MEQIGYIKLHRRILDNPISTKSNYAWLWVVLLLKANHKEEKFIWNGGLISVKEGQFITGRKQLKEATGIPESTIEDILNYFERQQQIQQQKTTKYRLITILKWKDYQVSDNKATTKQQQSDTNKNEKNEKKIAETSSACGKEDKPFDWPEYLEIVRNDKQPHIRLIGSFFKAKGLTFSNKKQVGDAIKRNLRMAKTLSSGYSPQEVAEGINWCRKEHSDIWTLETLLKYFTNHRKQ